MSLRFLALLLLLLLCAAGGAAADAPPPPPPPPPPPAPPGEAWIPAPSQPPTLRAPVPLDAITPTAAPLPPVPVGEVALAAACCPNPWSFAIGASIGIGKGNSDFLDFRGDLSAKREATPWGFEGGVTFVYSERDGVSTAENWRVKARVDRKLSSRTYAFLRGQYDRDDLANLEYRISVVAGVGRTLYQTDRTSFQGEAGLGGTAEKRRGFAAAFDPSAYVGLDYERSWADGRKFTASLDFLPNLSDFDLSLSTFEVHHSSPLCDGCLLLDFGLRLDYVIDPPGGADNLDLLFTAGLKVEL